jgi:nitroreductase
MNVTDALISRFTCRAFKSEPVKKKMILEILEVATRAPSWANTQPWEIFVAGGKVLENIRKIFLENVQNDVPRAPENPVPEKWPPALKKRSEELRAERLKTIGLKGDDPDALKANFEQNARFFRAPAVIYLCLDRSLTPWSMFDLGLLAQSIMLEAREYGLDSAPAVMLVAYPEIIRAALGIPENLSIVFGIALGYADGQSPQNKYRTTRRPLREVIRFQGF